MAEFVLRNKESIVVSITRVVRRDTLLRTWNPSRHFIAAKSWNHFKGNLSAYENQRKSDFRSLAFSRASLRERRAGYRKETESNVAGSGGLATNERDEPGRQRRQFLFILADNWNREDFSTKGIDATTGIASK